MKAIDTQTISTISELIRSQQLSPVAIVKACLAQIEALNPRLNAFITILEEDALNAANEAEKEIKKGNWRGALHGIPVAVKDLQTSPRAVPMMPKLCSKYLWVIKKRMEVLLSMI
ncbi:amidase family protein [Chitinophagaceae bacterium LB-8]|uniref:Amidase family protein n=1 Tax=Paraflavisolibacter caeni TaxID=2982496 RepID=A0A9X3B843_9BACT|nr:amidase family protein [Paraflavisolibacter caeni]MCU7550115.1 amidase family protein [Paraflavisolibacter caeni]